MSYESGGLIEASDYNTLREQVLEIYGTGHGTYGYGQSGINLPVIQSGYVDPVRAIEWRNLRAMVETCADHQGTSKSLLPSSGQFQTGQPIRAFDGESITNDMPEMMSRISSGRLDVDNNATSVFYNRVNQTNNGSWSTRAQTVFQINFDTEDKTRFFFNSGGRLIFRFARTGGASSQQNTVWSSMLENIGSVYFDYTRTVATSAGEGSEVGYYNLLEDEYSLVYSNVRGTGAYSGNELRIEAMAKNYTGSNGANGRSIRFRITFDDNHTGYYDSANGKLHVNMDELRATTYLNVDSFNVNIITPLAAT